MYQLIGLLILVLVLFALLFVGVAALGQLVSGWFLVVPGAALVVFLIGAGWYFVIVRRP